MSAVAHKAKRAAAPASVRERALVSVRGVGKRYPLEDGAEVDALAGFDLDIADKEFVSLIGPSGCGKSTALSIVAGLQEPTHGEVLIAGHPPARARADREIGVVFQQPVLLPWRTIRANCTLLLEVAGRWTKEAEERASAILEIVGLADFAERYPHQLSGGMKQRAAIARALCLDPLLLLMDEPFGALDEFTRHQMNIELMRIWSRDRKTILFVTHNIAEAVFMSDRVIAMSPRPGRIVEEITVPLPRPRDPDVRFTREFTECVFHLQRLLERDEGRLP
nr:ABC transporter ATP-binding protein [Propylenella binzhouense]